MASAHVVKILNVIGHFHAQFNNGGPGFMVEKFGLHSSPERFDHGIDAPIFVKQRFQGLRAWL